MKSRIHNALAVAPTINIVRGQIFPPYVALIRPTIKVRTETEVAALCDSLGSAAETETITAQPEIAFVHVSERQHTASAAADQIITVGQRSQQKRKRKRNMASNDAEDDIEMFDYTVEPSLLDGGDVKEVGPVTKKRNKGKHIYPYDLMRETLTASRTSTNEAREFPSPPQSPQSAEER